MREFRLYRPACATYSFPLPRLDHKTPLVTPIP